MTQEKTIAQRAEEYASRYKEEVAGGLKAAFVTGARSEREFYRAEVKRVRRERDLAIAHDRQPYPTADAYEGACKTCERFRTALKKILTQPFNGDWDAQAVYVQSVLDNKERARKTLETTRRPDIGERGAAKLEDWEEFHGYKTGDCPHDTQAECDASLATDQYVGRSAVACFNSLCDVSWKNGKAVWRRPHQKDDIVTICGSCVGLLQNDVLTKP